MAGDLIPRFTWDSEQRRHGAVQRRPGGDLSRDSADDSARRIRYGASVGASWRANWSDAPSKVAKIAGSAAALESGSVWDGTIGGVSVVWRLDPAQFLLAERLSGGKWAVRCWQLSEHRKLTWRRREDLLATTQGAVSSRTAYASTVLELFPGPAKQEVEKIGRADWEYSFSWEFAGVSVEQHAWVVRIGEGRIVACIADRLAGSEAEVLRRPWQARGNVATARRVSYRDSLSTVPAADGLSPGGGELRTLPES